MANDYRPSINRLRERLRESDDIAEADAEALLEYSRELDALGQAEIGDASHEKYLMRLVKMAEETGGLADALESTDAAKDLNSWIEDTYQNPESNKTARDSLRSFGEHATEDEGKPDSIEWIPTGYPSNFDRSPDPSKMYRWEDHVVPMLDACRNFRDEALIALAFDIGPRSGELQDLTIGDLSDHDYGLQVTVDGKVGRRSPVLLIAPNRVQQWLQTHPAPDDPTAPLWSKLNSPESISPEMIRKIFRQAVDRVDITPPSTPTPTRFRKSSASHLARRGVSQTALENRYGWVRGSDEAARYIAVFGEESEREIAMALGVDVGDDEPEPLGPITCTRCDQETPRDKDRCVWCGQPLSLEAANEAKATQKAGLQALAQLVAEDDVPEDDAVEVIDGLIDSRVQAALDEDGHD
ncbi:site-specific integrase [Haloarcula sp. S1AR25-5A]|uniref:Site-specific integrase n=1 Tax=Haloarcula terrestris TaxID=2950533 RepID=A0AAE4JGU7_9EURY|nr:tyrosine-type recombinase/integrase [Haloarcula terrestris]MDS0220865.1 site-specific integrase [Haloarcula terrestris]